MPMSSTRAALRVAAILGPAGRLGAGFTLRNASRNGVAVGTVIVGTGLIIGVGSMVEGINVAVADWVDTWLCAHVEVQLGSRNRWCRQWREHPAAVLYLGQMYADYTRALTDPKLGMANFIRNSLNYYRGHLFAPDGPFASCDPHRHEPPTMLPASGVDSSAESD